MRTAIALPCCDRVALKGGTAVSIGLRRVVVAVATLTALAISLFGAGSVAAVEKFYRFEEVATAQWRTVEECADGTTSTTFVSVIGGLEFESPDVDDVNEFVTLRFLNFGTCEGGFINEFGTGPAEFTASPSLQQASVVGTVTLRSGEQADINVTWHATSSMETTVNTTQFTGFVGVFTGQERDAVATGSVVVDGENLISGPSVSARIETLEDRNLRTS